MQKKQPSGSTRRQTPGRGRALPPAKKLNVSRLHAGVIWVLGQLIRVRYRLPLAEVSARAHVGEQTLRDYLHYKHPEAWTTNNLTALALGVYPDDLERLTRRWMRKFRRREKLAHLGQAGWKLVYPWERSPREMKQPPGQA